MLGFALLGWYAGQAQPLIGYGGVGFILAVIAWEYATTPFRVRVTPSALEIDWPCRRQRIVKGRVLRIELEDKRVNHARRVQVTIQLGGESKPIPLKALGLQSVELYRILRSWRDDV